MPNENKQKRTVKYDESLMEKYIRDYPDIFLGEKLKFIAQQHQISGFRIDLIFETLMKEILIVEVQQNALDRSHLYRALEYRDLFLLENPDVKVRVLVVANSIRENHKRLLKVHNVKSMIIKRKDFISKIKKINPGLKIVEGESDNLPSTQTFLSVVSSLPQSETNPRCPEGYLIYHVFDALFEPYGYANLPYDFSDPKEVEFNKKYLRGTVYQNIVNPDFYNIDNHEISCLLDFYESLCGSFRGEYSFFWGDHRNIFDAFYEAGISYSGFALDAVNYDEYLRNRKRKAQAIDRYIQKFVGEYTSARKTVDALNRHFKYLQRYKGLFWAGDTLTECCLFPCLLARLGACGSIRPHTNDESFKKAILQSPLAPTSDQWITIECILYSTMYLRRQGYELEFEPPLNCMKPYSYEIKWYRKDIGTGSFFSDRFVKKLRGPLMSQNLSDAFIEMSRRYFEVPTLEFSYDPIEDGVLARHLLEDLQ